MSNLDTVLKEAAALEGAVAAALVDQSTGMPLGTVLEQPSFDIELAAAGSTDVLRAELRTVESLGDGDTVEDILITLDRHHHLIRVAPGGLFLYLVLERSRANLALARLKLAALVTTLVL